MKDLIRKILKEETEEVFEIPGLGYFPDGVEGLRRLIEKKNIKRWSLDDKLDLYNYKGDLSFLDGLVSIKGYLDLRWTTIESFENLKYVGGSLGLYGSPIKSLGNLKHVGGSLDIRGTQIKSFGYLQSVDGFLWLNNYLSKKYTDEEIRSMINVGGTILRP